VRHEVVAQQIRGRDLAQGVPCSWRICRRFLPGTGVFSAHGVSQAVRKDAEARGLRVFVCDLPAGAPRCTWRLRDCGEQGREIVMIGHRGPPLSRGTMGQSAGGMYLVETPQEVAPTARRKRNATSPSSRRTTLSVDGCGGRDQGAARAVSRHTSGRKKTTSAMPRRNRQDAVKALAAQCDVVIVVGSRNSSNYNRLREVAENFGPSGLHGRQRRRSATRAGWLGKKRVGVTAGASAPEVLVQGRDRSPARAWGDRRERDGWDCRDRRVPDCRRSSRRSNSCASAVPEKQNPAIEAGSV
jgi:4-hydroxy-3-methylbut-2-enyl diphosphate reductase